MDKAEKHLVFVNSQKLAKPVLSIMTKQVEIQNRIPFRSLWKNFHKLKMWRNMELPRQIVVSAEEQSYRRVSRRYTSQASKQNKGQGLMMIKPLP